MDESQALAKGETRFRTIPQMLAGPVLSALRQVEGAPISNSGFEVLPLLTSPCDMYAVAVLAIRILLVDDENTLAVALDEMLSLARQVATEHDTNIVLGERLRRIVANDRRWGQSLGPQRLVRDAVAREAAARILPAELWWETLGVIIRLFPGIGPEASAGTSVTRLAWLWSEFLKRRLPRSTSCCCAHAALSWPTGTRISKYMMRFTR